ncbi:MAG: hypothetical protein WC858_01480 [Parcubacteria group bacterium]|jgi:hypothetical protein
MEKIKETLEEKTYSEQLEDGLSIGPIIDELENNFDEYLGKGGIENVDEAELFDKIKHFMRDEKENIQALFNGSKLANWNCFTVSAMTCLLANRKGFNIKIGKSRAVGEKLYTFLVGENNKIYRVNNLKHEVEDPKVMDAHVILNHFNALRVAYGVAPTLARCEGRLKEMKKKIDEKKEKYKT